ncbi:unnamed protein product [Rotaria sordida]|uniref:Uncharacterized protein n=2 Tax=Rotaria sordida TaxID=392033 RepID=A0A814YAB5_9BILA|nr:unnamed protein product [Rotaria sordida]CAF3866461.1 unnamed protein product [Rotaria sordida]
MDRMHASNLDEIIAAEFKWTISEHATTLYNPPRKIINEALLNVHKNNETVLPSYAALQRIIGCKCKKNIILLPCSISFRNIIISQQFKLTSNGDRCLLYDTEDNNARIIILSSDNDLNHLCGPKHWHAAGTFKFKYRMLIWRETQISGT